ncbi:MAG: helix-turn-helix domain-containing protein [Chloroflexota bacterium]
MDVASAVPAASFEPFGAFWKYLRRRARLTQFQLALATGYSEAHVCRLERHQRPPDLTVLTAPIVPALRLEAQPEMVGRMLQLAAAARGELLPHSITLTAGLPRQDDRLGSVGAERSPAPLLPPITPIRVELPMYSYVFEQLRRSHRRTAGDWPLPGRS